MQKREGDKRKKGWRKRRRKWRRNVSFGGIRHSVETLVITDEMNNLWASLWCFFMEAGAPCVISAFPLETPWPSLKTYLQNSIQFLSNIFLIPNRIASPLTFVYLRNKALLFLQGHIYHRTRKPGWTNAKVLSMPCWLWVALDVCDVGAAMGS